MPPEPQSRIPLGGIGPHLHGRNDQEARGKSSSLHATPAASVFPHNCRPVDCARRHGSLQAMWWWPGGNGNCDGRGHMGTCPARANC